MVSLCELWSVVDIRAATDLRARAHIHECAQRHICTRASTNACAFMTKRLCRETNPCMHVRRRTDRQTACSHAKRKAACDVYSVFLHGLHTYTQRTQEHIHTNRIHTRTICEHTKYIRTLKVHTFELADFLRADQKDTYAQNTFKHRMYTYKQAKFTHIFMNASKRRSHTDFMYTYIRAEHVRTRGKLSCS